MSRKWGQRDVAVVWMKSPHNVTRVLEWDAAVMAGSQNLVVISVEYRRCPFPEGGLTK
jgi:hypothetical protein